MSGGSQYGLQGDKAWRLGMVMTPSLTAVVALAIGGAHTYVLLAAAPLCLIGYACLLAGAGPLRGVQGLWPPAPVWVFVALSAYSALQALPLPLSVVALLNPSGAEVWEFSLSPFHETVTWGALSLDPGASVRESLKWLIYGLNFFAAVLVMQHHGRRVPALVVIGAGLVVALVTFGHALVQAEKVFGVYEPQLVTGSRWAIGPFLNPNTLSGYLNLAGFVGLGLVMSRRWPEQRLPLAIGVALMFGISVLSGSRGGIGAVPLGLLVFVLLNRSRWAGRYHGGAYLIPLGLFAAVGGSIAAVAVLPSAPAAQPADVDLEKLKLAVFALPLFKDFWALGVGRGAFASAFSAYAPPANIVYSFPENLVVQWVGEWGVPVALVAASALAVTFYRGTTRLKGDSLRAGAAAGIVAVLLQNLVDFGLERLATPLALTWALATLWRRRKEIPEPSRGKSASLVPVAMLGWGFALWGVAVSVARDDVMSQRQALYEAAQNLTQDRAGFRDFQGRLRSAMLRIPGEPYFARLGAEVSLSFNDKHVLRWVSRAIERGPNDPENHLLAARALARYGLKNQALLELRLAAEKSSHGAEAAGRTAAKWCKSIAELRRATPPGPSGAIVLTFAGRQLANTDPQLAGVALRAARKADGAYKPAREALAKYLIRELKQGRCAPSSACSAEAMQLAHVLVAQKDRAALGVRLKAQVLQGVGRANEASSMLAKTCSEFGDADFRECQQARLGMLRAMDESAAADIAAVAQDVAAHPCDDRKACAELYKDLGDALARKGEPLAALAQYERAVGQQPSLGAFLKIADLSAKLGQYKSAETALNRAEHYAKPGQTRRLEAKRAAIRRRMLESLQH